MIQEFLREEVPGETGAILDITDGAAHQAGLALRAHQVACNTTLDPARGRGGGGGGVTCAALVDGRGAGRQQTHGALQQRQHRVHLHGGHQAGAGPGIGNWYAVLGIGCHTITIE